MCECTRVDIKANKKNQDIYIDQNFMKFFIGTRNKILDIHRNKIII
jgi:hypothetical protein